MRVLLLIFIFLLFQVSSYSAEKNINRPSEQWGENASVLNDGFENQKPVTDTKLKKTIEMIKEKSLTKKQKKIRDEVKPLSPVPDNEYLKEFTMSQDPDNELSQTLTVMIPVWACDESGKTIPPGYYKLSCHKEGNNTYILELSQGTTKILTVEAHQTKLDLEQDTISFCDAKVIDDKRIRLMYGTIDLNLVGYLYIK